MFERFTREARAAVVGAQKVARDTGTRTVDTRHVLVALVEGSDAVRRALRTAGLDVDGLEAAARAELRADGLDGDALAALGIDLDAVRRQTDAVFGPGALDRAGRRPGSHIPFSADAKKALELSLREAIRLKERSIRSGHLLLGILRAGSPGRALLENAGVDADALRQALEQEMRAA
jgi:ATP-dependent Clp protease ATP-binding subunit ClpA